MPTYFDNNQCQVTKDAGMIAGLDAVRIHNEFTAASLAYDLGKLKQERMKREKVETRNEVENMICFTEKLLEQLKDKITEEQKLKVEAAIKKLKDILNKDTKTIKLKLDTLN